MMAAWYFELAGVVTIGIGAGLWAGNAVVADTGIPSTRPVLASYAPADPTTADGDVVRPGLAPVDYDRLAENCEGCDDYELGYRLARSEGVSETSQCNAYIWSYERGCLAYLRNERS